MKQMKRIAAMFLAVCLIVTFLPAPASAAEFVDAGACGENVYWYLFDEGTLCISGTGAMNDWDAYTSYTIPWYYYGPSYINRIMILGEVTHIGDWAFNGLCFVESIIWDDSLTSVSIGDYAFSNCLALNSVTIPNCITSIGASAFKGCANLQSVTIADSVASIGESVFSDCDKLVSVTIGNGINKISDDAFRSCDALKNVTIGNNVTIIGTRAFYECSSLTNVKFGSRVATIGNYAFAMCGLKHIKIPDCVFSIGDYAFWDCTKLASVALGKNASSIGSGAFQGCYNLASIAMECIESIGEGAFLHCSNLCAVFYGGSLEDEVTAGAYNSNLFNAQWHCPVTELDGVEPAYYCSDCAKCYWWDGSESHFTDVLTNNWQYTFAKYAVEHNLMAGTGTDAYGRVTFVPNKSITREEFVQVLYNASGKPTVTIANKFPDVANNGWYKNAVLWANENNIANGMGNGYFGIGKNITRQDLALMLYKYAALRGCSRDAAAGSIFQYADGNMVSGYAQTAMDWAVTNGILSGKGTAGEPIYTFRLDPAGTATRAECAAMLKNFMTVFGL